MTSDEEGRGVRSLVSNRATQISHDLKMTDNKIEYITTEITANSTIGNQDGIFFLKSGTALRISSKDSSPYCPKQSH
ncbi:hypothetical protein HPB50_025542 [Hyalomma asiaticum]|uniref:Uncharacterized protein n=1 Tax=Hyalomma asiaticum TaxID=266040 RepID=A0ACB7RRK7_HYAAI|nr:hypothetical protein HPB50_025542 [Hyalomma asiaticum]